MRSGVAVQRSLRATGPFRRARALRDRPRGARLHGDYRLKNALLAEGPGGWRVSGIVDFEMAAAGDPAQDLASFLSSLRPDDPGRPDVLDPGDAAAVCVGYGCPFPLAGELRRRVLLSQLGQAVEHLCWETSFRDAAGTARVLKRPTGLEAALDGDGEGRG